MHTSTHIHTCTLSIKNMYVYMFIPHTHTAWKNGWQVISPKKSFAVFAATPTEKAEWMAHINKCIVDLLARSESRLEWLLLVRYRAHFCYVLDI